MRWELRAALEEAASRLLQEGGQGGCRAPLARPEVERPRLAEHGDFSTNLAFVLARDLRRPAREVAGRLLEEASLPGWVERAEVAGGGFINFFAGPGYAGEVVSGILAAGEGYGRSDLGRGERLLLEFVSANPVGPLHVGHGRWAALGDSLARVLARAGWRVVREFYINDHGRQVRLFGESLASRYAALFGRDLPFPEEGYRGEYLEDLASRIAKEEGPALLDRPYEEVVARLAERGMELVLEEMREVLREFGVEFDSWMRESDLHRSGRVSRVLEELRQRGEVEEREGALWLRSGGEEGKERVLVRSTGEPTYLAADLAYHLEKLERGFERLLDIWGADHHAHVASVRAGLAALGKDPGRLEVILGQLVRLVRRGEPVRMSKRAGELVSFAEVLGEVGRDAARFWFLTRSPDQALDFDLEEAKEASERNPVWYVQYAHARCAGVLEYARERGLAPPSPGAPELELLTHPLEKALALELADFPEVVEEAALARAAHRITRYLLDLAGAFHRFYTSLRVVGEEEPLAKARLGLVEASATVVREGLALLGVGAPSRM